MRYRLRNRTPPLRCHRLDHTLSPLSHLPSLVTLYVRDRTAFDTFMDTMKGIQKEGG